MTDKPVSKRAPARKYSAEFKRKVVEQSFAGKEPVMAVAKAHGISSSMIWRWRNEYRAGNAAALGVNFLPIGIKAPLAEQPSAAHQVDMPPDDRLELHLGSARLVIHGQPDSATLTNLIEVLR